MSLLDAMLLDPRRDPKDIWIALRTDGNIGSGTEGDPYNGGIRFGKAPNPSSIIRSGSDNKDATVTLPNHPYQEGDEVSISGATGSDAPYYNGRFLIFDVTATTFKYRMRHPGPGDNATGSFQCVQVLEYLFDTVMTDAPANAVIHLGPGTFETRGYSAGVAEGWQPKPGQKIMGSGQAVTVLKLMHASGEDQIFRAIGADYNAAVDHFEAADFTIDCNMGGQPIAAEKHFSQVACAALSVPGSHIRLQRLRVINFGTQTFMQECFVLGIGPAHPNTPEIVDCVVEDCIVEQPSENNVRECTLMIYSNGERPSDGIMAYPRGCVARNNYLDCTHSRGAVAIESISSSGNTATVTTKEPHGKMVGDWVAISGAHLDGALDTEFYNGTFAITAVNSTNQFEYTMSGTPPGANPTGDMYVNRFSSHYIAVESLTCENTGTEEDPTWMATLETYTPHYRKPGNNVRVWAFNPADGSKPYFGSFPVETVVNSKTLQYHMDIEPSQSPPIIIFIGTDYHGFSAGGPGTVFEGNRIVNCRFALSTMTPGARAPSSCATITLSR